MFFRGSENAYELVYSVDKTDGTVVFWLSEGVGPVKLDDPEHYDKKPILRLPLVTKEDDDLERFSGRQIKSIVTPSKVVYREKQPSDSRTLRGLHLSQLLVLVSGQQSTIPMAKFSFPAQVDYTLLLPEDHSHTLGDKAERAIKSFCHAHLKSIREKSQSGVGSNTMLVLRGVMHP